MDAYGELVAAWKGLRSAEISVREVACEGVARTLLCAEAGEQTLPAIALAAGVHGDEPAGPRALLMLLASGALSPKFAYRIWPCTNPSGYARGTRENAEGIDVNRTFGRGGSAPESRAMLVANRNRKFALSLDLHEDCDAEGFYCYEYGRRDIGETVIHAVRAAGFPIQDLARCDLSAQFRAEELTDGVVRPGPVRESRDIGGFSYSLILARGSAHRALTLETPSGLPFEQRVAMHMCAAKAAIDALAKPDPV